MPVPALVVHGVANRDEKAFEAQVRELQRRIGDGYELIPVWWGDLGGKTEYLRDTLPEMAAVTVRGEAATGIDEAVLAELARATVAGGEDEVRSKDQREDIIVQAAQGQTSPEVRSEEAEELAEAVRSAWPQTTYLKLVRSAAVLEAVGRAVGAAAAGDTGPSDGGDGEFVTRSTVQDPFTEVDTRSVRANVGRVVRAVMSEIDKVVGGVVGQVLGDVNRNLRTTLAEPIGCFLGDILAYQRNQADIQNRLWQTVCHKTPGWGVEGKPISVLAHSLGGVIAFDAATRTEEPVWIDGLVTFGSQAAFFEVVDPRQSLPRYTSGKPIVLPKTIARWTNLWEPLDILAFAAGKVFRLHSGLNAIDIPTVHDFKSGLSTHGSYWGSPELVAAIGQTIPT